jgi:hypothetical protein
MIVEKVGRRQSDFAHAKESIVLQLLMFSAVNSHDVCTPGVDHQGMRLRWPAFEFGSIAISRRGGVSIIFPHRDEGAFS